MAAGKRKFAVFNRPGALDVCSLPTAETGEDRDVTDRAVDIIRSRRPDVMFVHLPGVDNAGHRFGWSSARQMEALRVADAQVGRLLTALSDAGIRESTVVILTADHGGAGRTHGPDDARSRHVPWIMAGPGIRKGLDLTLCADLSVDAEDTFATATHVLGLTMTSPLNGRAVAEAFDVGNGGELLRAAGE